VSCWPRKHESTKAPFFCVCAFSWLIAPALFSGCRRAPAAPALLAQVSGTIEVDGISEAVRIVRDRWGVPHIYAQTQDDLFFAQGLVQAQDRLFQMDLWRRSVQGRLSEVLGPNFIERDAMTRRVQYRGDVDAEWAAYGADVRAIASAFVRGINAWVTMVRERPPEEFVLAGWTPDFWSPADLLNRTDAFLLSGDAIDEVRRAGLSDVIADALRRVGTPPFFSGLAAAIPAAGLPAAPERTGGSPARGGGKAEPASEKDAAARATPRSVSHVAVTRGGALSLGEARTRFDHPAARYFVHLNAPGWNVIGATAPWLPGVGWGHNHRIAWGMTMASADTQDLYVDGATAGIAKTAIKDSIVVKGRKTPFDFEIELTPRGVVIASDRAHDRVFTVRWSGMEPGAAAELGALGVDRARTWSEFRTALARWRMPSRRVLYADVDGNVGFQDAALVPVRRAGEWAGWLTLDDLPHAFNPPGSSIAAQDPRGAPFSPPREALFAHVLGVTAAARERFDIGPIDRPGTDDSGVRAVFDPAGWDRSQAILAPGQSGSPASPHFSDLATLWARSDAFPLAFSDAAVQATAASTLTLVNLRRR
jgi:penicillin amidase